MAMTTATVMAGMIERLVVRAMAMVRMRVIEELRLTMMVVMVVMVLL